MKPGKFALGLLIGTVYGFVLGVAVVAFVSDYL